MNAFDRIADNFKWKIRQLILVIFLMLAFVAVASVCNAESKTIMPVTHVVSSGFKRDGNYYQPTGRIIFTASKKEFSTISTFDEFLVSPNNKEKFVTVVLMKDNQIIASAQEQIPLGYSYMHLSLDWNISNKEPGIYVFGIATENQVINFYVFEIVE